MSIALVLAAASSAATTPPIVVRIARPEHGTIEHMSIAARDRASHAHVTITFELGTLRDEPQEVVLPLDISRDVEVTGLALAAGNRMAIAFADTPRGARDTYRGIKDMVRDPALLEWTSSTRHTDRLTLRVYPITNRDAATVTLELELAHGAKLVIDPGTQSLANVDVDLGVATRWATFAAPRTLALADAIAADVFEIRYRPRVDRHHSLLALPELSGMPRVRHDNITLLELVIAHREALGRCYEHGRELDPLLASRIELVVRLAPDAAAKVGVGGIDNAAVTTCLVREITSWPFPAVDRTVTGHTDTDLALLPALENYQLVTSLPKP